MAGAGPSVVDILAVIRGMAEGDRAQVEAALAREVPGMDVGGGDGAHPTSAITGACAGAKVWMYSEEGEEYMLAADWIAALNEAEAQQTHGIKLDFKNRYNHWFGVKVDGDEMWYTDYKKKTEGQLYRKQMILLDPEKIQREAQNGSTAGIDELQQDVAWSLRWQWEDTSGWVTMKLHVCAFLLSQLLEGKDEATFTHEWVSPVTGKERKTIYDVDFVSGVQTSRDRGNNTRAVRLVAMKQCVA